MARILYICYFGVREPLVQTQVLPYLREIRKGGDFNAKTQRREDTSITSSADHPADEASAPLLKPGGELNPTTPPNQGGELRVSLLTFEPARGEGDLAEFDTIRKRLAAEGIEWEWLPYHKRPSAIATAWDIFRGAFYIWRRIGRFDILHGRVHVPTLMGVLGRKFSWRRPKLLFDIRGFFPEEYTDAGVWPEGGLLYRGAKRVERWLMKEADGFVVLTEKAREILFGKTEAEPPQILMEQHGKAEPFRTSGGTAARDLSNPKSKIQNPKSTVRPVEVIPCCVDFERRFSGDRETLRSAVRKDLKIEKRFVIIHVGALGGLYLTNEIADLLAVSRERNPATFALFLSQTDRQIIEPLLIQRGFGSGDYFIGRLSPVQIEGYLYASDVGLSVVKATYATQSRSPTKIPEYLACGLPIIANEGVGDVDSLILENDVGALLTDFSPAGYAAALDEIENLGNIADRCRETARSEFDLETVGGMKYRRIYRKLLA